MLFVLKCCGLIFSIVMAIIVLLLDTWLRVLEVPICAKRKWSSLLYEVLGEAKGQSAMEMGLLGSLMSISPQHQVFLQGLDGPQSAGNVSPGYRQLPQHESPL